MYHKKGPMNALTRLAIANAIGDQTGLPTDKALEATRVSRQVGARAEAQPWIAVPGDPIPA